MTHSGVIKDGEHRFRLRVYYEDTDAAGIVYHANYLCFAERGRTEMLHAAGADHRRLASEDGVGFAVRRCVVDYVRPARLDDRLEVRTRFKRVTGARAEALQTVHYVDADERAEDEPLVSLDLTLACIDGRGRPVRWPPSVLAAFDVVRHSATAAPGTEPR